MAVLISSLTRWNSDQGLPAGSSNPQCSFFTFGGNIGQLLSASLHKVTTKSDWFSIFLSIKLEV